MRKIMTLVGLTLATAGAVLWLRNPVEEQYGPVGTGSSDPAPSGAWFENITSDCGIDFRHRSGHSSAYYLPESMSGGVCLLDFDRDGLLDVYFVQGGQLVGERQASDTNRLYRNQGGGRFVDVTASAGVGNAAYGMGCACGDFDGDGWTDLYVTNVGANVLYRNQGDGTFSDVTRSAGVGDEAFSASAAFVDYDHDGDLDLFVTNYVLWDVDCEVKCVGPRGLADYCTPKAYQPARDTLYRNNGGGVFEDVSDASGIARAFGNGLGVVCGDMNGDGLIDITVANDLVANQMWINQGDGTFRDEARERGAAYSGTGMAESGMGIDARDVDGDGDLDLYMTHFDAQTNTFYRNEDGFFADRTDRAGLGGSLPFVGFGTAMVDLNNDGELDIFVANGRVVAGPSFGGAADRYAIPNQLFIGLGGGRFEEYMPRGGTEKPLVFSSRGAAFGDFDNDGDIDVFVVNRDGPAHVLRNLVGQKQHWIAFEVIGPSGGPAIGAQLKVQADGRTWYADVRAGYSYCSSSDTRVYVGLGDRDRIDKVSVTWVDGTQSTFGPYAANQIVKMEKLVESIE